MITGRASFSVAPTHPTQNINTVSLETRTYTMASHPLAEPFKRRREGWIGEGIRHVVSDGNAGGYQEPEANHSSCRRRRAWRGVLQQWRRKKPKAAGSINTTLSIFSLGSWAYWTHRLDRRLDKLADTKHDKPSYLDILILHCLGAEPGQQLPDRLEEKVGGPTFEKKKKKKKKKGGREKERTRATRRPKWHQRKQKKQRGGNL